MKPPRLPPPPPDENRAWLCLLANQAATPGWGTIMAGRIWMGRGQLTLALLGFCLCVFWIFRSTENAMLRQMGEPLLPARDGLGSWGAACFLAAWAWCWFSSISILREARRRARAKPPVLAEPR